MSVDHKSHCHRKNTRLATKCPCQRHDRHVEDDLTPLSTKECVVFEYIEANKNWDTSRYSSHQTKDRASAIEVEQFLNKINEPLEAWYRQYGEIVANGIKYQLKAAFLLIFLFPLFFVYVCWLDAQQKKARAKLVEVRDQICEIIERRGAYFSAKGLAWNVPEQFPQWIELWLEEEDRFAGKEEEGLALVAYENSGYPKSPQYGNKVVPIGGQQQYHANMYGR